MDLVEFGRICVEFRRHKNKLVSKYVFPSPCKPNESLICVDLAARWRSYACEKGCGGQEPALSPTSSASATNGDAPDVSKHGTQARHKSQRQTRNTSMAAAGDFTRMPAMGGSKERQMSRHSTADDQGQGKLGQQTSRGGGCAVGGTISSPPECTTGEMASSSKAVPRGRQPTSCAECPLHAVGPRHRRM